MIHGFFRSFYTAESNLKSKFFNLFGMKSNYVQWDSFENYKNRPPGTIIKAMQEPTLENEKVIWNLHGSPNKVH